MIVKHIDAHGRRVLLNALKAVRESDPKKYPYVAGIKYGFALGLITCTPIDVQGRLSNLLANAADQSQREAYGILELAA